MAGGAHNILCGVVIQFVRWQFVSEIRNYAAGVAVHILHQGNGARPDGSALSADNVLTSVIQPFDFEITVRLAVGTTRISHQVIQF